MAMLLTTGVSAALFGLVPSLQLCLGIGTASISLALYYLPASVLHASSESLTGPKGLGSGNKGALLPLTSREPRDA